MLDYDQIVTLGAERQVAYLAAAKQRQLIELVTAGQHHSIRVWLGQRLVAWGQRLMRGKAIPVIPLTSETMARY